MKKQRPILQVPLSIQEQILDWVAIVGLITIGVISFQAWMILPTIVPVHFDLTGQPNGWGPKAIVWFFPALGLFTYFSLTRLRQVPHTFNYLVTITEQNALRQYQIACSLLTWIRTENIWLLAYIDWQILHLAMTAPRIDGLGLWFLPIIMVILFGTIAIFMVQSYQAR